MKRKCIWGLSLAFVSLLACSCGQSPVSSSSQASSSASSLAKSSSATSSTPASSASVSSAYSSSQSVSSSATSILKKTTVSLSVDTNTGTETQQEDLYFITGEGDVPFLCVNNSADILQRSSNDLTVSFANPIISVNRGENAGQILLDATQKKVTFKNLDLYAANHGKTSELDLVKDYGVTSDKKTRYIKNQDSEGRNYYRSGHDVSVDLTSYQIPVYLLDGQVYLPVQTFSDLFLASRNIYLLYNGIALYMSGANLSTSLISDFYKATPGNRSEATAKFTYHELTLFLDIYYGLKDEKKIESFATLCEKNGLDESLQSLDPVTSDKAFLKLLDSYLADYHSGFLRPSAYAGTANAKTITSDTSLYAPGFQEYYLIRQTYLQTRKAYYNAKTATEAIVKDAPDAYEEVGDTAYVTFDQFTEPGSGVDYYTTTPTASATDTFGILGYAHSQIFRDGSPVKNVVLDLSCNQGGAINAGAYVAGWFSPYGIINVENTITGAQASFTYQSDLNYDGVYDTTDRLWGRKKLYCLVSPAAFSCANYTACFLKDTDQVRLIGRQTGGGCCVVQYFPLADGTFGQTSGNKKLCRVKNGTFTNNDNGVDVDYSLDSLVDFFKRTTLTTKIDSLY